MEVHIGNEQVGSAPDKDVPSSRNKCQEREQKVAAVDVLDPTIEFCMHLDADTDIYEKTRRKRELAEALIDEERRKCGLQDSYLSGDMKDEYAERLQNTNVFPETGLTSVAHALKVAKDMRFFTKQYDGRSRDKIIDLSRIDTAPEITIERRSKLRLEKTPREEFRELSYVFHGKRPSYRKEEKRMKKQRQSQLESSMRSTDTPLRSVQALNKAKEAMKQPFIVLC